MVGHMLTHKVQLRLPAFEFSHLLSHVVLFFPSPHVCCHSQRSNYELKKKQPFDYIFSLIVHVWFAENSH